MRVGWRNRSRLSTHNSSVSKLGFQLTFTLLQSMITNFWEQVDLPKGAWFDLISEKSKRHGSICISCKIPNRSVLGILKHLDKGHLYHIKLEVVCPKLGSCRHDDFMNVSKSTKTTCGGKEYMEAVILVYHVPWFQFFIRWRSNNSFSGLHNHELCL